MKTVMSICPVTNSVLKPVMNRESHLLTASGLVIFKRTGIYHAQYQFSLRSMLELFRCDLLRPRVTWPPAPWCLRDSRQKRNCSMSAEILDLPYFQLVQLWHQTLAELNIFSSKELSFELSFGNVLSSYYIIIERSEALDYSHRREPRHYFRDVYFSCWPFTGIEQQGWLGVLLSPGPKPLSPKPKNPKPRGLGLTLKSCRPPTTTTTKLLSMKEGSHN